MRHAAEDPMQHIKIPVQPLQFVEATEILMGL